MKILLIGKNGQLGWELQRTCLTLGEVISVDYPEIDLSKTDGIREVIRTVKPNLIINAAAYTNVDKAESEPELARKVNALAPAVMAEEMKRSNGAFIHYSTDYVFDGSKGSAYVETDLPNPLNVYGATKLEGEQLVQAIGGATLIFRTSWVYSMRQAGFVTKVLQWAREQETLRIVDDQIGSPTWARMLAEATSQVVAQGRRAPVEYIKEKAGLYHLAGAGSCSRFEWAKAILELDPNKKEQLVEGFLPAKSTEFPTLSMRPMNTELNCQGFFKTFVLNIPNWRLSLFLAMNKTDSGAINILNQNLIKNSSLLKRLIHKINKKQIIETDLLLIRSSNYFDEAWYLKKYPDIPKARFDPIKHYLLYGGFEGRDPGPNFCSSWYLDTYKDVKKHRINPLIHYLKFGLIEGRSAHPDKNSIPLNTMEVQHDQKLRKQLVISEEPKVHYSPKLEEDKSEKGKNTKKIVLLVHQFLPDFYSGTEILTYETAKQLRKQGYEVIVFTGWPSKNHLKDYERFDRYMYEGIRVERFYHGYMPMGNQDNIQELEYNNQLFKKYFMDFLRYEKPDLVHFFHLSRLSASAIDACTELNIHTVLTPTDFWLICPTSHLRLSGNRNCPGPDENGINCLRHIAEVRQISRLNQIIKFIPDWIVNIIILYIKQGHDFDDRYSKLIRALINRKMYLRDRMNRVERVIVPTKVMLSNLLNNGLNNKLTEMLPYGINFENRINLKRHKPSGILRMGYIGTLYEHKGVHVLLEAVKRLEGQPIDLKIYGNLHDFPDYVKKLRGIIQEDSRVHFCGTFSNNKIESVFSELDVLVVPSLWHENAPLVVYSAQAAGCPVIASDMEGLSELICHMENGLLFKHGSVTDLISVLKLLIDNKDLLQVLSNNAKRPLSMHEYGIRLSAIYNELFLTRKSL